MSIWTHISGCIRFDNIVLTGLDTTEETLRARFGKTFTWESPIEDWEGCTVPYGSEGSVQYNVVKTAPDDDCIAWGLVYIWGDLRDFSDVDSIYRWLTKACEGQWVRLCAVKIEVEGGRSAIIVDQDEGTLALIDLPIAGEGTC